VLLRVEPHGLLRLAVPQFLPSSALFALHPSVSVLSHKLNIRFCVTFAHHIRISSSTTSLRNSWVHHRSLLLDQTLCVASLMESVYDAAPKGRSWCMKTRFPPWPLSAASLYFHVGRQGRICLERGTALVCHVVIALAHDPSCQFKSSDQCRCSLAPSSIKSP